MSRFLYTANSLITVDSWIIRIGLVFGVAASVALAASGWSIGFTVLAAAIATGLANNAYLLKRSQRRLLVPGLNETTAQTSIVIVLCMWLGIAMLILLQHGLAIDRIALSLLIIAFATWFGWGEKLVFGILIALVFATVLMVGWLKFTSTEVRVSFFDLLMYVGSGDGQKLRNISSIGIAAAGCWAIYRYWRLAVARNVAGSEIRLNHLIEQQVASAIKLSPTGNIGDLKANKTPTNQPGRSNSSRLVSLLYGRIAFSRKGYFWLCGVSFLVIAAMAICRGHDEATVVINSFAGGLVVIIPIILFANRLPQAFRRAWVLGVSEDRVATVRRILLLVVRRSAIWFSIVLFFLAIQSEARITHLSSALFLFLKFVGLSGCVLWVTARWFVFWSRCSEITILLVGCTVGIAILYAAALSAVDFIPGFDEIPELTRNMIQSFGVAQTLVGMASLVALIWLWCIADAPRALGRDYRLLE